ncbi:MAG: ABC transporter substrate-binding protein [Gammaproteobacteria bacterium]|nr:ABC transporter substrate-binding protein [Gammaproteobacteria bacterium]MBU1415832.1 ABC transporter substrate-binding protein [Gammaproteobacteria bacterium]
MKRLLVFLAGLLAATFSIADDIAPDALVRMVSNDVLEIVRKDKDIQSGDLRKAVELAEVKVLPHFDFAHMTKLAVGKDWRKATADQRQSLTQEFRTLLVRTYSKAFVEYRNQAIAFKPLKMQPADTDVLVRTVVNQTAGKPVQIDYNLEKTDQGWKVYDIAVAGISLVTTYRSSFAQEISTHGIDGLIASLRAKNQTGDDSVATKG